MEHGEAAELLLDELVDLGLQVLHDRFPLLRRGCEDLDEVGGGGAFGLETLNGELGTVPLAQEAGLLLGGCNSPVRVVENPRGFGVVDEALDVTVELGDDQIADFGIAIALSALRTTKELVNIPLLQQLRDEELGVFALSQHLELSLQLACNHSPLLNSRVFDRRLDNAHGVVLEHKVLHTAGNDVEQFLDQLLALLLLDVRLQAQLLPELLGPLDDVGVRLRGFALFGELLLLGVGFS